MTRAQRIKAFEDQIGMSYSDFLDIIRANRREYTEAQTACAVFRNWSRAVHYEQDQNGNLTAKGNEDWRRVSEDWLNTAEVEVDEYLDHYNEVYLPVARLAWPQSNLQEKTRDDLPFYRYMEVPS